MSGFLDAEQVLTSLGKGESILTKQIHYIAFDEKITLDTLSELESQCLSLGYSFNKVKIRQSHHTHYPVFIYIIKTEQTHPQPELKLSRKAIRG
jgi:hypothetical protein